MWLLWILAGVVFLGVLYFLWSKSFGTFNQDWVATVIEVSEVFQPKRRYLDENKTEVTLYLQEKNGRERTYSFVKGEYSSEIRGVKVGDQLIKSKGEEKPQIDNRSR